MNKVEEKIEEICEKRLNLNALELRYQLQELVEIIEFEVKKAYKQGIEDFEKEYLNMVHKGIKI